MILTLDLAFLAAMAALILRRGGDDPRLLLSLLYANSPMSLAFLITVFDKPGARKNFIFNLLVCFVIIAHINWYMWFWYIYLEKSLRIEFSKVHRFFLFLICIEFVALILHWPSVFMRQDPATTDSNRKSPSEDRPKVRR